MNSHQVEAWYDGLGAEKAARDGMGARSAGLLSALLNVLLVYAVVQLAVSLPSLDRQGQSAARERAGGRQPADRSGPRVRLGRWTLALQPPQHGVDEAGGARRFGAGELDRLRDRRMRGDAQEEQLVDTEAEDLDDNGNVSCPELTWYAPRLFGDFW